VAIERLCISHQKLLVGYQLAWISVALCRCRDLEVYDPAACRVGFIGSYQVAARAVSAPSESCRARRYAHSKISHRYLSGILIPVALVVYVDRFVALVAIAARWRSSIAASRIGSYWLATSYLESVFHSVAAEIGKSTTPRHGKSDL